VVDKQSGQVEKIEAGLQRDMSDIGLRSLSVHVEYKTFDLGKTAGDMILPAEAVVDVTTPRQHCAIRTPLTATRPSRRKLNKTECEGSRRQAGYAGNSLEQHPDKKEKP